MRTLFRFLWYFMTFGYLRHPFAVKKVRKVVPCNAVDCKRSADYPQVFCKKHWKKLPDENKYALINAYHHAVGQNCSPFRMALVRAINIIAIAEMKMTWEEAADREMDMENALNNEEEYRFDDTKRRDSHE